MGFPTWPRSERRLGRLRRRDVDRVLEINPEQWAEIANGDPLDPENVDLDDGPDGGSLELVILQLLEVLGDETATMVPPSAGAMDRDEWSRMSAGNRARCRRLQLDSLDPRLLSRVILHSSGRRHSPSRR